MDDAYFMRRAIELGKRSSRIRRLRGPYVGAVVVKDGNVVGEGYKRFFSEMKSMLFHAERDALKIAGNSARGATLYTTLQPCTGQYKTVFGPCCDLIVEYGIGKVVIGLTPHNGLNTVGIRLMQQGGIDVVLFDGFQDELDQLRLGLYAVPVS